MSVSFTANTKERSASPIRNNMGNPRTKTIKRGTRRGQLRQMRYSNTGRRQPNLAYNENNPWENPRFSEIRRHNIRMRKQFGIPLNNPWEDPPEDPVDPVEVTAVQDPKTGKWYNNICNTITQVCVTVAIAGIAAKAKGLWGGRRTRRKSSKV